MVPVIKVDKFSESSWPCNTILYALALAPLPKDCAAVCIKRERYAVR